MDFLDDDADISLDDESLPPSSQDDNPRRSRKRQRTNQFQSDDEEYDLPSNPDHGREESRLGSTEAHRSKYEDRIHVPQYGDRTTNTFVTQLTQQWSSPSRIRGPRWMKPRADSPASPACSLGKGKVMPLKKPLQPEPSSCTVDEFEDEEDDLVLLQAFEAAAAAGQTVQNVTTSFGSETVFSNSSGPMNCVPLQKSQSFRQTTLHGIQTTQRAPAMTQTQSRAHIWPLLNRNEPPTHHRLNPEAMATWVYPTNLGRIRDYQYNIVHKGLFNNLLIALPTGLGKTFIAATVMLNWFRWTKDAQIIFVAPTKPLVSQQVDACFNIAGIPRSQTTMLTGEVAPGIRAEEWQEKRVFFLTPQTLINDLKNGMCDPKKIVLVVVDEAHKATGNYAYVEVIRFLRRYNSSFRVLALTATPGSTVESVQAVIDGLGIARVEIRTEDSMDIRDFVHTRNVETQIFDNSDEVTMCLELFCAATRPLLAKLCSQNVYWTKNPESITLFGLKTSCDKWAKSEAGRNASFAIKGMVRAVATVMMTLAHNLELLKYHGIGPFYRKMKAFADSASSGGKYAKQIVEDENFKKLMNRLRSWVNNPDFIGHPKLSYLKTVILNHFMDAGEGQAGSKTSNTRIMVFAHYRDSAEEIVRVLKRHGPMIRPRVFVGQSGTKGSEGMDQKTQLDVIKKFKDGTFNTIVATSIGEEGLDIGEVDLIVCYDCSKSPIRMLQRMGRTGRKRAGNIVLLLMRGKEESDYMKAKDNYQKMQAKIESGRDFKFHDDLSPRIVPRDIVPVVDKRVVEIPIENSQAGTIEPRRKKSNNLKKPKKKFRMPDGVETGFAFVGAGKKQGKGLKTRNPLSECKIDLDIALLPSVKEVLLNGDQEGQLESNYIRVAGKEDQFIQAVRLDAFPEQQQVLGPFDLIKHSRMTNHLVRAYGAMRNPHQDWTRPSRYTEFDSSLSEYVDPGTFPESKTRTRRSPSTLSCDSVGSPPVQSTGKSSGTGEEFRGGNPLSGHGDVLNKPTLDLTELFEASQGSLGFGDGDDMPELEYILGKSIRMKTDGATAVPLARGSRRRRIIDSDDDEDD
ncbi:fanconi anemia group M protein [Exophiala aquamarina CBS 119918]|uniref:ATP-dependent DNA helicase n=1 Tax=Exophiala aquamarina CBS 119918 TaxID=1182545 RepID=A0A072P6M0_9EURO|nr:fanconi anemia group M protein [Exophiala aquamarina CBS 119918]KEF54933.1 fanconi anemia group M protein [Exophiala aquamarina CBS 119918]